MAHPCISCGSECYCSGDIDDIIVSHTPMSCVGCDWCGDVDDDYFHDYEEDDDAHPGFGCMDYALGGGHGCDTQCEACQQHVKENTFECKVCGDPSPGEDQLCDNCHETIYFFTTIGRFPAQTIKT